MTTYPQQNSFGKVWLLALVVLGLIAWIFFAQMWNDGNFNHADWSHGRESREIKDCIKNHGPTMVYKHRTFNFWYFLCEFRPGKWGYLAFDKNGEEITAFSPKNGIWNEVRSHLDQFATRFTKRVPFIPKIK